MQYGNQGCCEPFEATGASVDVLIGGMDPLPALGHEPVGDTGEAVVECVVVIGWIEQSANGGEK